MMPLYSFYVPALISSAILPKAIFLTSKPINMNKIYFLYLVFYYIYRYSSLLMPYETGMGHYRSSAMVTDE